MLAIAMTVRITAAIPIAGQTKAACPSIFRNAEKSSTVFGTILVKWVARCGLQNTTENMLAKINADYEFNPIPSRSHSCRTTGHEAKGRILFAAIG